MTHPHPTRLNWALLGALATVVVVNVVLLILKVVT
ncbi:hypothetical protein LCGC14_1789320 [marine sediment metagenome]|uniref:Uncharacterized protein n=1 Tax=marine sediment metagenome TaxID=412755 RepID=A0A0F9GT01_9ZZZZ